MTVVRLWQRLPRLLRIILSRLALIIPQMLGVLFVTFMLVRLLPGDPARLILGNFATEASIAAYREKLGLNEGVVTQFVLYMQNVLKGDLGVSPFTSNPIVTDLADRAPATLELIFYAMFLTIVFGVTVGILSVVKSGGPVDVASRVYSLAAGAIPDFWVALLLIFFFFHMLGWSPAPFGRIDVMLSPPPVVTGFYTVDSLIAGDWTAFRSSASRLILPVLTLTIVNGGALMAMSRTVFAGIYRSEFVDHMRACGVPERKIVGATLRNSLPPIISLFCFLLGFLLGAAVLVETIFSWGGLGQYAVQAVINSDYGALQGFILVAAAFILIVYSVADILYELADPRIRI